MLRPLKNKNIDCLEQYVHDNMYSLQFLKAVMNELKYRNTETYPRYWALKNYANKRIKDLKNLYKLLADHIKVDSFKVWFFSEGKRRKIFRKAVTTGGQPLNEDAFDNLLREHNITPYNLGTNIGIFIVGQENWNSEELLKQLYVRTGKTIKIYSQEMVLAYLACGKDPFDDPEVLDYFASCGHPALDFFAEIGFTWPTTLAPEGLGILSEIYWPEKGLLNKMRYTTGKSGRALSDRRKILKDVFVSKTLPLVHSQQYMDQWGTAESQKRLYKLANSIASFARNHKRQNPDAYFLSIQQWEEDLDWLYQTFYIRDFTFSWPLTFVGKEYFKKRKA